MPSHLDLFEMFGKTLCFFHVAISTFKRNYGATIELSAPSPSQGRTRLRCFVFNFFFSCVQGGRAIARARAGTRSRLHLGAINRAPSYKHFPCEERHPESDNR